MKNNKKIGRGCMIDSKDLERMIELIELQQDKAFEKLTETNKRNNTTIRIIAICVTIIALTLMIGNFLI